MTSRAIFAQEEKFYIKDTATVIVGEGDESRTVRDPDPGGSGANPPPILSCGSGNYEACLKNQFNIRAIYGNPPQSDLRDTYEGFVKWSGYKTFLSLFRRANVAIQYWQASKRGDGAWGVVYYEYGVQQMDFYKNIFRSSTRYKNYFFSHEPAHVINYLIPYQVNIFYSHAYTLGEDRGCFDNHGVIKTYASNLLIKDGYPLEKRKRESFADAVSNTILCRNDAVCPSNGGGGESIWDFPDTCDYMYNFVHKNLE